ncbi:unnamed protein product [Mesocestoides corti]|uniref:SCP domain-containing protein n=1 Tax=Mesocestoides corti TaxID=53468 RepID=A0A0R3UQ45_MESCO|nr:unnamed protein product [Mesocestoides corti]
MERLALDWVRRCRYEHPDPDIYPQYKNIGQNLAIMTIDTPDWVTMAQGWFDEVEDYDHASNRCREHIELVKQ